ncbi:hypothetical protein K6U37_11885 [Vibrio parahaemolyticus]|uniref:hypothetical protein n=1 Tax=Vibrio parahaemolyticus TaxID=670 RepID=UPI001EEC9B76|nr:hypothetical protein [Vibrio parahaemolyticus]MCG6489653.1 hypothetical protein [Vibrio parahaemolyticus]
MSDNYKLFINFLLDNDSITVDSVVYYLNLEQDVAQELINEFIEKGLLANGINNNGVTEYFVVFENVDEYIIEREGKKHTDTNSVITADNNGKSELFVGIISVISGIVFLCFFLYSCTGKNNQEPKRDYCNDDDYAYISAKSFIRKNLKSPDSAKFSHLSETQVNRYEKCVFEFTGYVDAQNSFGATLRENYKIKIKYNDEKDTYYLIDLNM